MASLNWMHSAQQGPYMPGGQRPRPSDTKPEEIHLPQAKGDCIPQCPYLHQIADSLSQAMEAKDQCTRHHSEQVANLACVLAHEAGMSAHQADLIHLAGHLHDIGKIGIPDKILQKSGPLNSREWELVRQHPVTGAQIVSPVEGLNGQTGIAQMILHHHERWDGKGYPHGLKGRKIPWGARILAVSDALSAMLQDRPYRPGMSFDEAMHEMRRVAGAQLDPELVDVMQDKVGKTLRQVKPKSASEALTGLSGQLAPLGAAASVYAR